MNEMIENKKEMFEKVDEFMRELFNYACNGTDMTEDEKDRLGNEILKFYKTAHQIADGAIKEDK